jgi:hypothetical protein
MCAFGACVRTAPVTQTVRIQCNFSTRLRLGHKTAAFGANADGGQELGLPPTIRCVGMRVTRKVEAKHYMAP